MTARIVLLTQEFPPFAGGVATYCDRLSRHLVAEHQPVVVVAPRYGQQDADLDRTAPFETVRYPESRLYGLRHLQRLIGLIHAVRRHRPVLIWAADWRVGALVLPVALACRLPMAVTVYGSELLAAQRSPWKRFVASRVYGRAVAVFAISSYVVRLLADSGVDERRVHLVPLGVDRAPNGDSYSRAVLDEQAAAVKRRHGLDGRRVVLTLARLTQRKGQDTAILALVEVLKRRSDVKYLVAGTGPDRRRLECLAERLGVSDDVVFAGNVPEEEKAAYFRACDVFVMLSRQDDCWVEGFGLAFLEAALEAKPVVGTDHGGVPDAVVHGRTGLIVPPSDPAAAAEAIMTLLDDAALARDLGEMGRQRASEEFTWQRTARRSLACLPSGLFRPAAVLGKR
jgi:phosphatidyl-myo-inositol dimannoside synthase